jgi:predicted CoA-substrate-specific enzyme activase
MYSAGVDVGAASGEVVIWDGKEIVAFSIVPTGFNSRRAAYLAMEKALEGTTFSQDEIGSIVATGYGRVAIDYAQRQVTEISCYAKGINHLHPEVRTIVDIGGQDSKVISVGEDGRVVDFLMNDKCAAGTGRFLEVMAKALELSVEDLGDISLQAKKPLPISSTCTVFAESEVVTLVAEGVNRDDIVAGLHAAIAKRTLSMVRRLGLVPPVAMAGGVAKNAGVVKAVEEEIGERLIVPSEPQIVGALGAAILAMEAHQGEAQWAEEAPKVTIS